MTQTRGIPTMLLSKTPTTKIIIWISKVNLPNVALYKGEHFIWNCSLKYAKKHYERAVIEFIEKWLPDYLFIISIVRHYYEAGFNWPKIWVIVPDKTPQAQTGPHTLRKDPTRPTQSSDMPRSSTKPIVETCVGYWRAHW